MFIITDIDDKKYNLIVIKFSDRSVNVKIPEQVKCIKKLELVSEDISSEMCILDNLLDIISYNPLLISKDAVFLVKYLPYGRADRVFEKNMAIPLKISVVLFSFFPFKEIIFWDVHSKVFFDLCKEFGVTNFTNIEQHELIKEYFYDEIKDTIIVSPDKGAREKSNLVASMFNAPMINVDKIRDVKTGHITSIKVEEGNYNGLNFTIVDDICDGGGTFIPIAKYLKENGASTVNLYVTHGIFSKGLSIFEKYIDNIYTPNIVCNYVTSKDIEDFNSKQ